MEGRKCAFMVMDTCTYPEYDDRDGGLIGRLYSTTFCISGKIFSLDNLFQCLASQDLKPRQDQCLHLLMVLGIREIKNEFAFV